jgi:hypothetical protein
MSKQAQVHRIQANVNIDRIIECARMESAIDNENDEENFVMAEIGE